ncbi:DUF1592 domain-containing protein [Aliiglaciecola lipolytica]|uniref:Cytochrome c domain-containing protein n=1 Tax=Aliiglaciecola lipolytica E3 TaxID=1127673 RepID=K6Y4C3_9ALTE|nr:DUF1592 domain-containing protein [Aliiglaciecola lipolytica]GAC13112.1 hypothetical protein GLIP_0466 [Aliiglaciecola lipolytica E3]
MTLFRAIKPVWVLTLMVLILLGIAATVPINGASGDGVSRFIGRFHILVLHFPVTLLLLAPALSLYAYFTRNAAFKPFVRFLWWLGSVAVFITVSMGMLLAANEGFEIAEVRLHMLGGLSVAILTFFATALLTSSTPKAWYKFAYVSVSGALVIGLFVTAHAGGNLVHGESYLVRFAPSPIAQWFQTKQQTELTVVDDAVYNDQVRPLLTQYCFGCHGSDTQKGGVQLDVLNPDFVVGNDAPHWHAALDMINSGEMPPAKKKQPSAEERRVLVDWMTNGIHLAKEAKKGKSQQTIRRLTKQQYQNTLVELTSVDANFASLLPDDPLSEIGFSNNAELLQNSTLHLETFEQIARQALDKAIDPADKPEVVHYRMHFGKDIGVGEKHSKSSGYLDVPLPTKDFYVEVLDENGQPKSEAELGDLKKYFSASLRGSDKRRFKAESGHLSLFSAKPHKEINEPGKFGSWHGPSPNLAMQIKRYFPSEGEFILRIKAGKGSSFKIPVTFAAALPNLLPITSLDEYKQPKVTSEKSVVMTAATGNSSTNLVKSGPQSDLVVLKENEMQGFENFKVKLPTQQQAFYEINLVHPEMAKGEQTEVEIQFGKTAKFAHQLTSTGRAQTGEMVVSKLGAAMLKGDAHQVKLNVGQNFPGFSHLILTKTTLNESEAKKFENPYFVNQVNTHSSPVVVPFVGSRTDDGMDYKNLKHVETIKSEEGHSEIYSFRGRLENFPLPSVDAEGDQWVSGSLKVGLWNGDMINQEADAGSVINVDYIEFEAPYIEQWPSRSHRQIFVDSDLDKSSPEYARLIIKEFAKRAYRRPVSESEIQPYFEFWQAIAPEFERFEESIKEPLVAILSSTSFLYMAEPNDSFEAPDKTSEVVNDAPNQLFELLGIGSVQASENHHSLVTDYALANRLSYFLWNSPPDQELLSLAAKGELRNELDTQVKRMLTDTQRLQRFVTVFAREWLRLDRLENQTVDVESFPDFNRFVKKDMAMETTEFLTYLIQQDLSALNIIESDFAMLNQNLAEFYGLEGVTGPTFRKVTLDESTGRGGLLGQGAFLTGHADGVHSHPVKRAVWLKAKIMGVEPPPPPPNVPQLDPDTPGFDKLTLKQQLELHRDKDSCRDCHAKIDPYGLVFENYDAVGRYRDSYKGAVVDSLSVLPDGIEVNGLGEIKGYLLNAKQDQVVMSLVKHLYAYALGKEVNFHDESELNDLLEKVKNEDYSMQSVILSIIQSPSFNQA